MNLGKYKKKPVTEARTIRHYRREAISKRELFSTNVALAQVARIAPYPAGIGYSSLAPNSPNPL